MMYQSIKGARNAGTHGILSAPNVSGRQFNIWGAAAITTKGQMILADTLDYLKKKGIRVVYGDTDGIYLACSRSIGNIPNLSNTLNVIIENDKKDWLSYPEYVLSAIKDCNKRWQTELKYPDFELEPELHDCMIFVKHKNYLIFDEKNEKIEMITKGNNFKGSDKANIARKILKDIMINVIKENPNWTDEKKVRDNIKKSITENTKKILLKFDLSKVNIDDLTLIQSVKPSNQYKKNQNGSMSTFGKRAFALENLLNKPIKSRMKLKFVVTKKHLPGISNPSKSGVKPIDYMYPIELLKDIKDIDLKWYKKMIENYIQGAFGLQNIEVTEQKGLDAWM
jgi:DNA polymerase elongation subunit (family B)